MSDNLSILEAAVETATTPTGRAEALLKLADHYNKTGDFLLQEQTARKALVLARGSENPSLQAKLYSHLGLATKSTGRCVDALQYFHQALALYEERSDKAGVANITCNIGLVYKEISEYLTALEYYHRALALFEAIEDKTGVANVIGSIGAVYWYLSDYTSALEYYHRALTVLEEIGDKRGVANNTCNIGAVYYNRAEYTSALEYYYRAIALFEEVEDKIGAANATGNIGVVYQDLSDYVSALEYHHRALSLCEEIGNKRGVASAMSNIGGIYTYFQNYVSALEYNHRALVVHEEIGNKHGIAIVTGNIGGVYHDLSEYSSALEYDYRALAMYEEIGDKRGVARINANIGWVYVMPDFTGYDPQKAEEYLLASLALNEKLGSKAQNLDVHKILSELYERLERWKEAYEQKTKFHVLEKEVQSEEAKKQAQKYEYESKLTEERARKEASDRILHKILPVSIAERLKRNESPIADHYETVSILFIDIVNFTPLATHVPANQLLYLLESIFSMCDEVVKEYGLEKIKTIGDSYMAVCGLPEVRQDHAEAAAGAALEMMKKLNTLHVNIPDHLEGERDWLKDGLELKVRMGLHCGSVVAGVIGSHKFAYDLWGDAVNIASRMESHSKVDCIHISEDFYEKIKGSYRCEERGEIEIKGKMKTYFLKEYIANDN